ncbi:MAG: alanine--glyoxylate aminotransferase family protein [Acidobacteriota bacterium]
MTPVEPIRFFLPGPAYVPEASRRAMTEPVVAHRSPEFLDVLDAVVAGLKEVFRTSGDVVVATGSATLMMQSAIASTVERRVLHLTAGAFSERWLAISRSLGKEADQVSVPWGQAVDPDLLRQALRRGGAGDRYDAVALVHNETSTAVMHPLPELAQVIREESDALVLVDTVSSLAGAPVEFDAWGLDVAVTASQKALATPPGLAPTAVSRRALERSRRMNGRGFYTDLVRYVEKQRGDGTSRGGTITTAAMAQVHALAHQLQRIRHEGLEARWQRHRRTSEGTVRWAEESGFEVAAEAGARSWTVTCLRPPAGREPATLRQRLAAGGWTVAGGYGDWKDTTFRIGHMGEVRESDLDPLRAAIEDILAAG